jgi:hypothetical protein
MKEAVKKILKTDENLVDITRYETGFRGEYGRRN